MLFQPSCVSSFLELVSGVEAATKQLHTTIQTIDVNYLSSDLGKLRLFDDSTEGLLVRAVVDRIEDFGG